MQKRTILAAFAAAAVVAAAPSVSRAQDPTPPTPAPAPAPQTRTSTGDVAKTPSFVSLMSALSSTAAHTEKLAAKTDLTAQNVQFVNVDELLQGSNAQALELALAKHEPQITALRTALAEHESFKTVLSTATTTPAATSTTSTTDTARSTATAAASSPITTDDIIAVDVQDEGDVVVYYRKKQS